MESNVLPGLFVGGGGGRIDELSSVIGFAVTTGLTGTTGPSPSQFILNERGVPASKKCHFNWSLLKDPTVVRYFNCSNKSQRKLAFLNV